MFNRKKKIADRLYRNHCALSEYLDMLYRIEILREEENTPFAKRLEKARYDASLEIVKIENDRNFKKYHSHLKFRI